MQYTLRNIPPELDAILRAEAKKSEKSLNQVTVDALMRAFGLRKERAPRRDLSFMVGSYEPDPTTDQVLEDQRQIDPDFWR